jgi:N-acetylmuramoyl-L-alanine amidase
VLRATLNENNTRAAKQIPDTVYLMNHISCPAILVECGFMSNGEEVSLLQTAGYQKKIATALTGACLQYLQTTA